MRLLNQPGEIILWADGYAMTLWATSSPVVRCCTGHATPEQAKSHGLERLLASATEVADLDIALWAAQEVA